ncbi:hypothetical protein [Roseovarius sp. M141]|uniref:hypothetical protein n=1 Tax=Roseovarius sp. M141 TaxID=2583806 RepID=UPI0020CFAA63|nr:hypothetical protein [Roseovarius sp. M141]MCQ0090913.1 hypothetical protein [Roseovarius sp. M141]
MALPPGVAYFTLHEASAQWERVVLADIAGWASVGRFKHDRSRPSVAFPNGPQPLSSGFGAVLVTDILQMFLAKLVERALYHSVGLSTWLQARPM